MKKGTVISCYGCKAFEESVRVCPPGSPAATTSTKPFCRLGYEIELFSVMKQLYCPVAGRCDKPRTIREATRLIGIYYASNIEDNPRKSENH